MELASVPVHGLWKLVRWVPGYFLRWHFTPEKLGQLIYVDMMPRGDQANIDLGEAPYFSLHLQVINLSPYAVELDRASFRFDIAGQSFNSSILKKQVIQPGRSTALYMRELIPDGHANVIARSVRQTQNWANLEGNIEFNCKVRSFAKTVGTLNAINCNIYNTHGRTKA